MVLTAKLEANAYASFKLCNGWLQFVNRDVYRLCVLKLLQYALANIVGQGFQQGLGLLHALLYQFVHRYIVDGLVQLRYMHLLRMMLQGYVYFKVATQYLLFGI